MEESGRKSMEEVRQTRKEGRSEKRMGSDGGRRRELDGGMNSRKEGSTKMLAEEKLSRTMNEEERKRKRNKFL